MRLRLQKPIQLRRLSTLFAALILLFTAVVAHAQDYTSIVVFGDSLSDSGNVAHLTLDKYGVQDSGSPRRLHRWALHGRRGHPAHCAKILRSMD